MKKAIVCLAFLWIPIFALAGENNKPIHVEVSGSGQPIIFIPGFTVPGEVWKPLVKRLEKNYECHVMTLAGFSTKAPIEFPWLPKINHAIEGYIQAENLEDVIVVGHSLGGTIATWLASRKESKVSQAIVVDALPATGALMFPNYDPDNLIYDSPYNKRQLQMDAEQFSMMAAGMAANMSLQKEHQEQIKQWILEADRETYVYGYTDYLKFDMREDLKHILIPVTIIAATLPYGKEMAGQTYKTQYANLKNYDLIFAEGAAHFIMLDKPDWFTSKIETLLSKG